jgi:ABC-type sugar transport system ATPase subunit
LDEPLSNLDARLRLEMREEIRRIQLEVGITAIFVTHDQEEAMSISDRIMLMKDGVLQQESHPQEMYRRPVNVFAAEFIGSPPINMLTREDGVRIGIRPEHLTLSDTDGFFSGDVSHVETIGRDTLIRVRSRDKADATVRAFVDGDAKIKIGDSVRLAVKPENIHAFDPATGERVEGSAV